MTQLRKLIHDLDPNYCSYELNPGNVSHEYKSPKLQGAGLPIERLSVYTKRKDQQVIIENFKDNLGSFFYECSDIHTLSDTLDKLFIPKRWPENLGDKVFHSLKSVLRYINEDGPIYFEQDIVPGKEHQFEKVLKSLIEIYKE